METEKGFTTLVAAMRAAQRQYLKSRNKYDLLKAKDLEEDVDRELWERGYMY